MKRFLILLLAALAVPTTVNAEVDNDYSLKYIQARILNYEKKFSESETKCDELIEISPDNPKGYFCKGLSIVNEEFHTNKTNPKKVVINEALKLFTKAIEIDPEFNEAYYLRGTLRFAMPRHSNRSNRACSDIKKAFLNGYVPAIAYVVKNQVNLNLKDVSCPLRKEVFK